MPPMNMMAGTGSSENITDRPQRRPPRIPAPDPPTDLPGSAYERRINSWDRLLIFWVLRVAELRKG